MSSSSKGARSLREEIGRAEGTTAGWPAQRSIPTTVIAASQEDTLTRLYTALRWEGIEIVAPLNPAFAEILTPDAFRLVATLTREFGSRRERLLRERWPFRMNLELGTAPDFLDTTRHVRESEWSVAPAPPDLVDRRVEITGPTDRKMIINALNSGANVYMADFEDAHSPTWTGTIQGQINLRDAVRGTIDYTSPDGKRYRLNEKTATLVVRPRGWHLVEKHVRVNGKPMPASLFDFALFFFHNAKALIGKGTGPYFYLPKIEHATEARLWNDVFVRAQELLGVARGTIRATVLIETLPAAFEMDEILYELREHASGLNCGRWDYIFSFIKQYRNDPRAVFPDRALVTMTTHFLSSYVRLAIQTCHRRNAHCIGGMAAQIPIRDDPQANEKAIAKVVADKEREVQEGHDGTWVAHPGLVSIARRVFDAGMPGPHQIHVKREDVRVTAADLLEVPKGPISEAGLRTNVNVALRYLQAWLGGMGCVPINHLMEDTATVEISRAQIWQWIRHGWQLDDGRTVTAGLFRVVLWEEVSEIERDLGGTLAEAQAIRKAAEILDDIVTDEEFVEFLTLEAYDSLEKDSWGRPHAERV